MTYLNWMVINRHLKSSGQCGYTISKRIPHYLRSSPALLSTAHTLKQLARGKLKFEKISRWNQSLRIFLESNIWMKWDWWFTYKRSKCRRSKSAFWKEEKSQKWSDCHCNLLPARSSFWQSESGAVVSFVVELIIKKYQMYNRPLHSVAVLRTLDGF